MLVGRGELRGRLLVGEGQGQLLAADLQLAGGAVEAGEGDRLEDATVLEHGVLPRLAGVGDVGGLVGGPAEGQVGADQPRGAIATRRARSSPARSGVGSALAASVRHRDLLGAWPIGIRARSAKRGRQERQAEGVRGCPLDLVDDVGLELRRTRPRRRMPG